MATINEARTRLELAMDNGEISVEEYTVMCKALDKLEYRAEYNRRPEVKAKRREYNQNRRAEEKMGRQMLMGLLKK